MVDLNLRNGGAAAALELGRHPAPRFGAVARMIEGMGEDTDEELVARTAQGDATAFRQLMERHMQRSLRLATRMMWNMSDAEEMVQEAFLRLWTKADTWQPGRGKFTTWFFRVLVNLCLDRKRRPSALPLEAAGDPHDPAPSAVQEIYRGEVERNVARAISELPDRQRAALTLCYFEELSNQEAAEALQVSVSALEALLVRARRTLKGKLAALGVRGPKEDE
jgi:RNA polymerase sigma-70 factor (ECF subfamily)